MDTLPAIRWCESRMTRTTSGGASRGTQYRFSSGEFSPAELAGLVVQPVPESQLH